MSSAHQTTLTSSSPNLDSFLEFGVSERAGHSQLAHNAVVDHETARVADTLGFVLAAGLVVRGEGNSLEISILTLQIRIKARAHVYV